MLYHFWWFYLLLRTLISHYLYQQILIVLPSPSPQVDLLLLLLSRFSHVRLCATPWMAAHEAPQSLGFSRQEHWSGLPFPSPMHESEKWRWSCWVLATPWTAAHQVPPSMGLSRQECWSWVPLPSPERAVNTLLKTIMILSTVKFTNSWL